jgi:hypothetical protein
LAFSIEPARLEPVVAVRTVRVRRPFGQPALEATAVTLPEAPSLAPGLHDQGARLRVLA